MRFALPLIPLIAVILVIAIDRARTLQRPASYLVPAVIVAALLPIAPTPFPTTSRPPVPEFISSGQWRDCVQPGGVMVPVPLPTPKDPHAMRWAAAANAQFAPAGGLLHRPVRAGRARVDRHLQAAHVGAAGGGGRVRHRAGGQPGTARPGRQGHRLLGCLMRGDRRTTSPTPARCATRWTCCSAPAGASATCGSGSSDQEGFSATARTDWPNGGRTSPSIRRSTGTKNRSNTRSSAPSRGRPRSSFTTSVQPIRPTALT